MCSSDIASSESTTPPADELFYKDQSLVNRCETKSNSLTCCNATATYGVLVILLVVSSIDKTPRWLPNRTWRFTKSRTSFLTWLVASGKDLLGSLYNYATAIIGFIYKMVYKAEAQTTNHKAQTKGQQNKQKSLRPKPLETRHLLAGPRVKEAGHVFVSSPSHPVRLDLTVTTSRAAPLKPSFHRSSYYRRASIESTWRSHPEPPKHPPHRVETTNHLSSFTLFLNIEELHRLNRDLIQQIKAANHMNHEPITTPDPESGTNPYPTKRLKHLKPATQDYESFHPPPPRRQKPAMAELKKPPPLGD
ncbi:hypothetical protein YC2023_017342 [Brassica napus]